VGALLEQGHLLHQHQLLLQVNHCAVVDRTTRTTTSCSTILLLLLGEECP
jgi:hypothetical protein